MHAVSGSYSRNTWKVFIDPFRFTLENKMGLLHPQPHPPVALQTKEAKMLVWNKARDASD